VKKLINDILASFNNYEQGASARKLTAFALMILIAYSHVKFVDLTNVVEVLIIDLSGVLLCLGLVSFEQIIKLKNGGSADATNS
jgi:hypothetical protein